ncbi:ABC-three component system middle component 6 [Campylobacter jejuni]
MNVMGNKLTKIEDSLFVIGGYILEILLQEKKAIDDLYSEFSRIYPKKISFETFMYTIDFLYMIKKLRIIKEDILEIII